MSRTTEEVPTIKVDVRMDGPHILLTPRDDSGSAMLQRIVDGMPDTLQWHFQGSRYDSPHSKDNLIGTSYACGGESYRREEGNLISTDYRGAVKVHFDLSEVEDQQARYAMRDFGYFNSVVMEPDSTVECLRLRTGLCKVCHGPLSEFIELGWGGVCNSCSAVCEHDYKEMVGQANGRIAYLPCCTKCGRGDPSWQPSENPYEDMAKTVSEGGLTALMLQHPDGSSTVITKK